MELKQIIQRVQFINNFKFIPLGIVIIGTLLFYMLGYGLCSLGRCPDPLIPTYLDFVGLFIFFIFHKSIIKKISALIYLPKIKSYIPDVEEKNFLQLIDIIKEVDKLNIYDPEKYIDSVREHYSKI